MKPNKVNKRQSNFELLRLIAIFMITAAHYFYYAYIMNPNVSGEINGLVNERIFLFFKSFGQVGVALFILISAYFLCAKKFSVRSYLKLILENIFYIIVIYVFILSFRCFYFHTDVFSFKKVIKDLISSLLPIFTRNNWFIAVYFCFYLIFPFLNLILNKVTKNQLLFMVASMVLSLIVVSSLQNIFIPDNMVVTNLLWWIILYYTAAYVRFYGRDFNKTWLAVAGVVICILVKLFFYKNTQYYENRNGFYVYFMSVFLFLVFKNMNLGYRPVINLLASTTLGVYMLGDTFFLYQELIPFNKIYTNNFFGLISIGVIIVIIIVFSILDLIRQTLLERPLFKILDKKLGNLYLKINNLYPYDEKLNSDDYQVNKYLEPCALCVFLMALVFQLVTVHAYAFFITGFAMMMIVVLFIKKKNKKCEKHSLNNIEKNNDESSK